MTRILVALPVLLAGCAAPGYWNHAHGDQARFQQDAAQCVYESKLATASTPYSTRLSAQVSQDIATGVQQGELQRLCMQAKGYYWVQQ